MNTVNALGLACPTPVIMAKKEIEEHPGEAVTVLVDNEGRAAPADRGGGQRLEALTGGWNTALGILNMGLISAILALGVNIQWGYAGLFNVGIVGFVAIGGLAPVLVGAAGEDFADYRSWADREIPVVICE